MTPDKTHSDALAPCPFCGAPAHGYAIEPHLHSPSLMRLVPELPDHPGSYVIEGQCACGSGLIGANEAEVVARWNTRWGSPVVAGPVAYRRPDKHGGFEYEDGITSFEHDPTAERLYTTPQPTQAQAGAVDDTALIRKLVEKLELFDDAGPLGEGWQSNELEQLIAAARARLKEIAP